MKSISSIVALSVLSAFAGAANLERRADRVSNAKTPPVTVQGNAFFANGKRFYIRGIDYQPGGSSKLTDPLADTTTCKRDVEEFKKLGINTVRIYTVDNSAAHDECMKVLADNGIYLALDVNTPQYSLNRDNPAAIAASYNDVYLQSILATVDQFAKYDNTLLFFSANEVINTPNTTFSAPYIKAVTRDIKSYMKSRGYRQIPVGYSAADVSEVRKDTALYMNCGGNDARSDFFAFNDYSWCSTDFQKSGWDQKVQDYSGYSIPLFLSEFGCVQNPPRSWGELGALYSDKMTSVYSGGLVYEYTMAENKYGVVEINGDAVKELPEFATLATAFKNNPAPSNNGGAKDNLPASACPAQSATWNVQNDSLPVTPDGAKKFFQNGAGLGPGIKAGDKGSQWAGTASVRWDKAGNSSTTAANSGKKNRSERSSSVPGSLLLMTMAGLLGVQFL